MKRRLTSISVSKARPSGERRVEVPDGGSGLYLVVHPSGKKSWVLRYRFHGKPTKLTLGRVIELMPGEKELDESLGAQGLTLGQARIKVAQLQSQLARGVDPSSERRVRAATVPKTFGEAFEQFMSLHAEPKTRATTAAETRRLVTKKALGDWRGRSLNSIRRRDVIELLDRVVAEGAPVSANGLLAAIRKFFNWCVERDYLEFSPCAGVKKPTVVPSRERVLSGDEMVAVWRAAERQGFPFGSMAQLLLLTGQRRDEVAKMRWSELDLDKRVWRLPSARVKNGRAHEVPLSALAIAVINALPRLHGEPDFVFTTGHGRRGGGHQGIRTIVPVSGFSRAKSELDKLVQDELGVLAAKSGEEPRAMPGWRIHDLRRTVATGMAELGVALPVVEKVLNHQSGSFAGIVGVYQRYSYAEEKRDALERWSTRIFQLCDLAQHDLKSAIAA